VKCCECSFIIQNPVILPCGKSICQKHVTKNIVHCRSCNEIHPVPENGFSFNQAIQLLLDINLGKYKQAKKACDTFRTAIDELERIKKEPTSQIEKSIDELKVNVQSSGDKLIKEIKLKRQRIMLDLDAYKQECIDWSRSEELRLKVEMKLKKKKLKLDYLMAELNNVDENKWEPILYRGESETRRTNEVISDFKRILLLNKLDDYNEKIKKVFQVYNVTERLLILTKPLIFSFDF
jgi:hypothetical protein